MVKMLTVLVIMILLAYMPYLCPPLPKWVGGHIVFGTDPVGVDVSVGIGIKLLVRSVT